MTNELKQIHFMTPPEQQGTVRIVSPENSCSKKITLDYLRFVKGETQVIKTELSEAAVIILSGTINISVDGKIQKLGSRDSVFNGKASALYLPTMSEVEIKADNDVEVVIAYTPSERKDFAIKLIQPEQVVEREVGRDNWYRHVHDIIGADFPADKLIIGETFNPAGNWSSSPPHKHDREQLPEESKFEEVYFYKVNPIQGFGLQRIYTTDKSLDLTLTVEDKHAVVIPKGYHPVVAAPGYELYYLWILVGEHRTPKWFEDPEHAWIKE